MSDTTFYEELHNLEWEKYVYIKCLICRGVYRFGIYGFREGRANCIYCGAASWNPFIVDKVEYRRFLDRMGNPQGLGQFQRKMWNPGTNDEAEQRR